MVPRIGSANRRLNQVEAAYTCTAAIGQSLIMSRNRVSKGDDIMPLTD